MTRTILSRVRILLLCLVLLPLSARLLRADPGGDTATRAQNAASEHFRKAEEMTHSKGMHLFTKEEFDALLSEYESGLEILLSGAEKAAGAEAPKLAEAAAPWLRSYANHALRRYQYDRVYEYWERIRKFKKDVPVEAVVASAIALRAHGAFAEGNDDEAIRIFHDMAEMSRSGSYNKLSLEPYYPEFYEQVVRRARELAANPVKPEYSLKVFSLRIGLVRFKWKHRLLNGQTEDVSTSPLKIKKGDVELADLSENSLRRTVLAMSDGKLDLVFEREALTDPVNVPLDDGREIGNGVSQSPSTAGDDIIDRVEGGLGDKLRSRVKASDAVFLFWWGTSPLTQHGGARTFKIDSSRRVRGNINIGVQFFHHSPAIDYMNCGSCMGPNGIGFYPQVYMHEFFHVVEARFGIKPVHGFTVPQQFPGWKGRNEIDYYWWQIRENIPALQKSRGKRGHWTEFTFL